MSAATTGAPATGAPGGPGASGRGFVARAAAVSALLAAAGSAFGLVRDLLVAGLYGATGETDAFLVAWTVPETVAPLLIEGTMAMVLVPAFGRALATAQRRGPGDAGTDPVRELVEATLPRILAVLAASGGLVALAAPWLVGVLAPGLADPVLAVRCLRAVAVTVPLLGLAGYLAAALRTHGRFAAPAAIYLVSNVGIVVTILATARGAGVLGAAAGIAVGAALMVAVQLPAARRVLPRPRTWSLRRSTGLLTLAVFLPVGAHTLARQGQTFVERFAAAPLAAGTISHLNYAQKVAQIPVTLSFMAAAVTFPIVARAVASGAPEQARARMRTDLLVLGGIALLVTAFLAVFAPQVVAALFERGAFTAADTAATAAVMRVYVLGLLGQTLVSLLVRPYFTDGAVVWFPAVAMAGGLAVTAAATAALVGPYGAPGIAGANALGISVTAAALGVGSRRRLPSAPTAGAYTRLALLLLPLAAAVALGLVLRAALAGAPALVVAGAGGAAMAAAFGASCLLVAGWRGRSR